MPFEMTIGLRVIDQSRYTRYREEMTPLLTQAGGSFRYDFEVSRTLKSEKDIVINRVFVIRFPDHATKEKFFADPRYLAVRKEYFEKAVEGTAIIAEYAAG